MLSHDKLWSAIDTLAERCGLTPSGLARRAGLDPTTFNRSKRLGQDGRPRWPSTESIAKLLEAAGTSLTEFAGYIETPVAMTFPATRFLPFIGFSEAQQASYFTPDGHPIIGGWDEVPFPGLDSTDPLEGTYALEINGTTMEPLYHDGNIIVVAPGAQVRRGDRVVVRTTSGDLLARVLWRRTQRHLELHCGDPDRPDLPIAHEAVAWLSRILWVSQ